MLCPKCNKEMSRGTLGGRGYNFFLPMGETFPGWYTDRILKKRNAIILPPDMYSLHNINNHPKAYWCGDCKMIIADYSDLMK